MESESLEQKSQFALLKTKRFLPFFLTQFLGAFNDNVFKNSLVVLLTFKIAEWTTMSAATVASIAPAIFLLPFFLFSATAGQLADKYNRDKIARIVKVFEMLIMLVVGLGFYLHSLTILFSALFMFGVHSAFFGPVKYAIIPQHLKKEELVGGNALIESGTFIAILLGTLVGAVLASQSNGEVYITVFGFLFALMGYITSRFIPQATAPVPELKVNYNPLTETFKNINFASKNKEVFFSILAISWFWLFGLVYLAEFPVYTQSVLHGKEEVITLLLGLFTIGIGVGSLLCEKLSGHKLNMKLVVVGALGLSIFTFDFGYASKILVDNKILEGNGLGIMELLSHIQVLRVFFDLAIVGLFGGFYCVPLYTMMQEKSEDDSRARMVASNNIMNSIFMVVGSVVITLLLSKLGLDLTTVFMVFASINILATLYIINKVPVLKSKIFFFLK